MKFLIIRFSSIGDIVLTTPVVRCLKEQVSDAEVHFLTKRVFAPVLEANPYIDKLVLLNDSWELMMHQLQSEKYDYVIDLHRNLRTWRVKRGLPGAQKFSFHKLNASKWLLTALKINLLPPVHIVDRYLNTVRSLGVVNDERGLDYFIPVRDQVKQQDLPASHWFGYIGVVIGAAHNTKKLPVHRLQELCRHLNYPVVLLGGKEDEAAGSEVASIDPIRIYNACGRFSLNESADLVRKAKLIISHDTGLMHIAAAFGRPVLSAWGNTVPAFGMWPYYGSTKPAPLNEVFEVKGLWCRPCSKIGYDRCPLKHFKCMEQQDVLRMAQVAMEAVIR